MLMRYAMPLRHFHVADFSYMLFITPYAAAAASAKMPYYAAADTCRLVAPPLFSPCYCQDAIMPMRYYVTI